MRKGWRIRTHYDAKTGNYWYFMLDNWIPAGQLNRLSLRGLLEEVTSLLNPIIKVPIELITNYNVWRGQQIARFPGQKKTLRIGIPGVSTQVAIDASWEHLARNVRAVNEMDRVIMAFDRGGLLAAVQRMVLGATYPVNFKDQKKWWGKYMGIRLSLLKQERSRVRNRIRRGRATAADQVNLAEIEAQLKEKQVFMREFR
jgi:hypothetical protein